jgi:hypothetical protein
MRYANAYHSGHAVWGMNCFRSLEHWCRRCESHSRHGYLCAFVLCVGSGLATGCPTGSVYDYRNEKSNQGPKKAVEPSMNEWVMQMNKKLNVSSGPIFLVVTERHLQLLRSCLFSRDILQRFQNLVTKRRTVHWMMNHCTTGGWPWPISDTPLIFPRSNWNNL